MSDDQEKPRARSAPRDRKPFAAGKPPRDDRPKGDRPSKAAAGRKPAPRREAEEGGERIAKRLARAGIASRREAEGLIADGRVRVNGTVLASPAFNVEPGDRIELDGREIPAPERTRLFLFHKPAGLVTTNRDPEGRRTVFDALPEGLPRLMTVGRLDINTEGLLLLTNDGGLARILELPSTGWLRRYRVRVHGEVDEAKLKELEQGIAVDGVFYGAIEAELDRTQGSNAWLVVGLREGKNREVKNVMGALGLEVTRLIRVSYGPFQLGELEEGQVQELKGRTLREQLGDRLVEEAGADFEAEVRQPFTNRPTARGREPAETRAPAREEPGEGGLIRNRKRAREQSREDALGRLGTRPERRFGKDKPFAAKTRGRDEAPPLPERTRSSNVWMAPGARPQGKDKPVRERSADVSDRPRREAPRGEREGGFRGRPEGESRPRPEPAARGGDAPRPFRPRREEDGERPFKHRRAEAEGRFDASRPSDGPRAKRPYTPRQGDGETGERSFKPRPPAGEGRFGAPGSSDAPRAKRPYTPRGDAETAERSFKPRRPDGETRFGAPRSSDAPRAKRPYALREGAGPGGEGGQRQWKPRRPAEGAERSEGRFDARPREDQRAERPYRPRRDERSASAGEGGQAGHPFKPRREEGERPPRRVGERPAGDRDAGGQRPFKPRRPAGEGPASAERPFSKGPRREGGKPFDKRPRADGAPRPFAKGPKREGGKPFAGKPFSGKPRGGGGKPRGPSRPRGE